MNSTTEMKDVKRRTADCINFMALCKLTLFENAVEVSFIESVYDGADTAGYDKTDFVLKININEMSLRILREGPKIPQYLN